MGEPVFATKTFTDMENSTQSGSSPSPQKSPTCCICTEDITCSTIVNTECNHSFCKDCFWKWTKSHNTCPLCRTSLLCNSEELAEQTHLRELLDQRSEIIRQVEEAYEEKDKVNYQRNQIENEMRSTLDKMATLKKALAVPSWKIVNLHQKKLDNILQQHETNTRYNFTKVLAELYNRHHDSHPHCRPRTDKFKTRSKIILEDIKRQRKKEKRKILRENNIEQLETEGYGLNRLFEETDNRASVDVMYPLLSLSIAQREQRRLRDRAPIFSPLPVRTTRQVPSLYREVRNIHYDSGQFDHHVTPQRLVLTPPRRPRAQAQVPPTLSRPLPLRSNPTASTSIPHGWTIHRISNTHTPRNSRIITNLLNLIENLD